MEKTNTYTISPNAGEKIIYNKVYIILSSIVAIVILALGIILTKMIIRVTDTRTSYDKYVDKVLREYDRLIVETHSQVNFNECNVISVDSFDELLDVRDNFKVPIVYLNTTPHVSGIFYIKNGVDVYLYTLNDSDLNNK